MTILARIADRVLNRPLLIHPGKAEVILGVLSGRLGVGELEIPEGDLLPETERGTGGGIDANRFIGSRIRGDGSLRVTRAADGVAQIPVLGSLVNRGTWIGARSGLTSYEGLAFQLRDAAADADVHTLLLDIDSPGGEAGGMLALAAQLRAMRGTRRVVAFVNDMAASAAYGLASAADEIVVSPTSLLGSIGVVLLHLDRSGELAAKGVKPTLIFAGAHKADGNPFGPLPEAVRADLQAEVDAIYGQFVDTVAAGRGVRLATDAIRATEARSFIGEEAIRRGLADRMASLDDLLTELASAGAAGPQRRLRMSNENASAGTQADHARAVAAAREDGKREGANAERARIGAILRAEAAKGRLGAALEIALETEMSAEAAAKVLAKVPADEPTAKVAGPAERAAGAPEIGGDAGGTGKPGAGQVDAAWGSAVERANARLGL